MMSDTEILKVDVSYAAQFSISKRIEGFSMISTSLKTR